MKENGFKMAKERSRRYPAPTIKETDYGDDIALLANIPAHAESQLHSLERVVGGLSLHVNADKTQYMCFKHRGDIFTLKGGHLKVVDKFTYLKSSASSIEKDIKTWLAHAWRAINRFSVIWKSDLTDKIKRSFFPQATATWMHHMVAN